MSHRIRWRAIAFVVAVFAGAFAAGAAPPDSPHAATHPAPPDVVTLPLQLAHGARIVLIGGGVFERMQEHGEFEAMLQRRFPDHELVVRTLAWSGDEVSLRPRPDKFGDLHDHLKAQKADVIFAAYGFNESFAGPEGLPKFEHELSLFLADLRRHNYNGRSAPRV